MISIVILGWNQAEYTRLCLESVRRFTPEPHELILVDNGSHDHTADVMRAVPDARVICNDANRGFAAGNNQGIAAARGDYVVLLNNDTIVTKGWLSRLVAHAARDPRVGMVGPMCNYVATDEQRVTERYDLEDLQKFAVLHARRNAGPALHTEFLSGVCWLIKRAVLDAVGGLDEAFAIGGFEDNDFCRRVIAAGWRLAIAPDAFIHHFGSRTFDGNGLDRNRIQDENGRRFAEKWGVAVRRADGTDWILPPILEAATRALAAGRRGEAIGHLRTHLARFPHDAACRGSLQRLLAEGPPAADIEIENPLAETPVP